MPKTGIRYVFSLFSANALQIVFSQLGSLFLFWLSSKELAKTDFGLFNWYFAIYGTISAILSFGFDYIVIQRVSAKNELEAARVQLLQNLVICLISLLPVLMIVFTGMGSSGFNQTICILIAFQFAFLSLPFKNALTGRELFIKSARSVIVSNVVKTLLIGYLYISNNITLISVSFVLAVSNFFELLFYGINSWNLFEKRLFTKFNFGFYKTLFKESLPQLGVIIFDSAFARIDWILLGLLSGAASAINTAEYSFAYKIFELSKLPLLILAPILFTRFSRLFYDPARITDEVRTGIFSFFKMELVLGMTVPLILNIAWVPLMQLFTSGKYGPENAGVYFLLSLTIPVMYLINFLWTIAFAQGQLKLTMTLSGVNSVLNIILNMILIPLYGQTGAAISFLACNVVMLPFYFRFVKQSQVKLPMIPAIAILIITLVSGCCAYFLPANVFLKCCVCLVVYCLLLLGTKIFTPTDLRRLKLFIKKD